MKPLFLIFMIILSHLSHAQIRTGGGIVEEEVKNVDKDLDGGGGSGISEQSKKIREYTSYLQQKEKICRGQGLRYLEIDPGFIEVYLKLSVLKNTYTADSHCANVSAYFKCLQDKTAKKKLKSILKDQKTIPYLQTQYGITEPEVEKMLKFFKLMDK